MSFRTVCLEKEYERVLSESARLLDVERDRMRRMEHLLLKFESDALRAQLDQANAQALRLATAESEASLQLDEACREIDRLDLHAQTSSGEIERLKVGARPTSKKVVGLTDGRESSPPSTVIRLATTVQLRKRSTSHETFQV